jgi:hypothetical protein
MTIFSHDNTPERAPRRPSLPSLSVNRAGDAFQRMGGPQHAANTSCSGFTFGEVPIYPSRAATVAAPNIALRHFARAPLRDTLDKSFSFVDQEQDQSASLTSFSSKVGTRKGGVSIEVEAIGVSSNPTFPGGYWWTQTIETNAPLHGATSPYVDPHPNDDTKPFYYTDAEYTRFPTTFHDAPTRTYPASGSTFWYGTLVLNGVNGTNVQHIDGLAYGFSLDSAGTVTQIGPNPPSIGNHVSVLTAEFPAWNFS